MLLIKPMILIQQSQNLGFAHVQIIIAVYWTVLIVRTSGNDHGWE